MICNIKLNNFKCFEELCLDCASLNLLCGLKGSGKSSVIQALLVLRQSFVARELLAGRLVLGGELADLGTGSDVLFEEAQENVVGFALQRNDIADPWELNFKYSSNANQLEADWAGPESLFECVSQEWQEVQPFGGHLLYITAERVGPRKQYPLSDVLARRGEFGTNSIYAWNYLLENRDKSIRGEDPRNIEKKPMRLIDLVDRWLQEISPGVQLRLDAVQATDALAPGFAFERIGDIPSRKHRATNVGFGLSYVLSVVLAALADRGTLCLVENPEAHLHPRGQTKLAELAVRAAKAGMQLFVETHSDHFMDGVRIAVREGLIAPKEVTLQYFNREGNNVSVSSPNVNADGRLSHWPAGFFDQREENLARLLAPRH